MLGFLSHTQFFFCCCCLFTCAPFLLLLFFFLPSPLLTLHFSLCIACVALLLRMRLCFFFLSLSYSTNSVFFYSEYSSFFLFFFFFILLLSSFRIDAFFFFKLFVRLCVCVYMCVIRDSFLSLVFFFCSLLCPGFKQLAQLSSLQRKTNCFFFFPYSHTHKHTHTHVLTYKTKEKKKRNTRYSCVTEATRR